MTCSHVTRFAIVVVPALLGLGMHCHRPMHDHHALLAEPNLQDESAPFLRSGIPVMVLSPSRTKSARGPVQRPIRRGIQRPGAIGGRAGGIVELKIFVSARERWALVAVPASVSGVGFRWSEVAGAQPGTRLSTGARLIARGRSSDEVVIPVAEPVRLYLVRPDIGSHRRDELTARVRVRKRDGTETARHGLAWSNPPSACGNEIVEPGETCDDGNLTPGDGCDACALEVSDCADRRRYGVLRDARCEERTSECTSGTCRAESACSSDPIHTRKVAVTIVGTGEVKPSNAMVVESNPPGIVCQCTETWRGRVCDSKCEAVFPRCTPVTLIARSGMGERFAGWAGSCSGSEQTCVVDTRDESSVEAYFRGSSPVTKVLSVPGEHAVQMRMWVDADGLIALSGTYTDKYELAGHHLVTTDYRYKHAYVAELSADDRVLHVLDLGTEAHVRPLGAAFDRDGIWLVTAEGQLSLAGRKTDSSRRDYPRIHVRRYARGELVARRKLRYAMGDWAHIQARPGGGAVVAMRSTPSKKDPRRSGDVAVAWLRPDGSQQREWHMATRVSTSLRAARLLSSGRLILAGTFDGQVPKDSPLFPGDRVTRSGLYRIELSADSAVARTESFGLPSDNRYGAVAIDRSGAGLVYLQSLNRHQGRQLWRMREWRQLPPAGLERKSTTTCYGSAIGDAIRVDPRTGRIAVVERECGAPSGDRHTYRFSVHLFSAEGEHERTWRLGRPGVWSQFEDFRFAPDGQLIVLAQTRGGVTLGDHQLYGDRSRVVLIWLTMTAGSDAAR